MTFNNQGVQRRMVLVVNCFVFLKLLFFALLLPSARYGGYKWSMLNANSIWNFFLKYCIVQFQGHHSYFRKMQFQGYQSYFKKDFKMQI